MIEREPYKTTEATKQGLKSDEKYVLVGLLLSEENDRTLTIKEQ